MSPTFLPVVLATLKPVASSCLTTGSAVFELGIVMYRSSFSSWERYITIPNSKTADPIVRQLEATRLKVANTTERKVGDILSKRKENAVKVQKQSVVYQVPCGSSDKKKKYVGETGRGIDVRLREHKRDMRNDMDHSAFVLHARKTNHLPNWGGASAIPASCRSRQNGKATEAAYIATCETIHIRVGFMKWAKSAEVFGLSTCRCDFYLIHVLLFLLLLF